MVSEAPGGTGAGGRYIDALTGLRIFPALVVVFSHLSPPQGAGPRLESFLASGYLGVTVFFVLSGFILTHKYFDRLLQQFSARLLGSYLVARVARIYPLYLLMLAWVSVPAFLASDFDGWLWLKHALALQAWTGSLNEVYTFNDPGWSISVEFFLYACFPLLVFVLSPALRTPRRALVLLLAVVGAMCAVTAYFYATGRDQLPWQDPQSAHRWLYRNPACRLGDFLLGMVTARLVTCRLPIPRPALSGGAVLAVLVIVTQMCWPEHLGTAASWDVSYALPAALLLFCLASAPSSLGGRFLAATPLVMLGEASYALYLCHMNMLRRLDLGDLPGAAWLANGMTILVVMAAAVGLHVAVERPARGLLRAWLDPLARRHAVVPAAREGTPAL